MINDPLNTHIYSPEDSDTSRWGDWQTKVAELAIAAVIVCCLLVYCAEMAHG